ncbi:hypothetical protein RJO15_11635 [Herbaspirillum huttiense F1]|jgi:hypothetical protein|uniref:Uncharacterized protein n=1 Tax=Herbaspirillum huttiense subsp. lycopersici TaxID=3074428 RepID=A0ABU2EJI0_9BURK|nr:MULTISPECIES: hypothetical protein [Herbaspirillum]MBP1316672.1 hypothetical protein [Herbaspirillum sp. 1130]MDR6739966.1 hypothetical protein [Herbaspirillum sp. 1173]MDR9848297.1 hypothetical protein [Herbaspirillum huttiense SE1]MDT0356426.1 hypothetical protein [Herbaspirillum huttiense F1]
MKIIFIFLVFSLTTASAQAGLDITAYENLTMVKSPVLSADGVPVAQNQIILFPSDFPERFEGLEAGKVYAFKSDFEFRAGTYSGYNHWRNELAKLAGYQQSSHVFNGKTELRYDATAWNLKSGPFWELINFSDAEGVIGPVVCKKIYKDFMRYADQAREHAENYFRESYDNWKKAFSMCAHDGAIVFH